MIDVHCHLLPGIDDGPESDDESVALARGLVDKGVERVVATPHVNLRYPNRSSAIGELRDRMVSLLERNSVELRVETGAEIAASVAIDMEDGELERLALGGGGWLLIEPPDTATHFGLHNLIFGVSGRGWRILLAHPERNPAIQGDLSLLESLVDGGIRTQVTSGSFSGSYGRAAKRVAEQMMDRGLVHTVASDAHHPTLRPPGISEPLTKAGYGDSVDWLCSEMPAWILDGGNEPGPPDRTTRSTLRDRLFGRFR